MQKTFCEFFAGIGLVGEALSRSGWRCVYANDIDPKKHAMHQGHYGPTSHYHLGDVWDVGEVLERIEGSPALATASFPCTDMSLAGKRRGLAGEQSGTLFGFLQVLDGLAERRPPLVLLENVPGFLTSHAGQDFATAIHELASLGYWVDSFVIDACWFVPQSRPRLFLVGYHDEIADSPRLIRRADESSLDDPWRRAIDRSEGIRPRRVLEAMQRSSPATGWITVDSGSPSRQSPRLNDFLDADDEQPWWGAAEVARHHEMMFDRHARQIDALRTAARGPTVLTAFRRVRDGRQRMEVRFDGVAGCLRTPRGGSAKQIVMLVADGDVKMRWMTPREYARLQGAPNYRLPENEIQGLFGFGDAVCVPAIEWIDRHMLSPVLDSISTRELRPKAEPVIAASV